MLKQQQDEPTGNSVPPVKVRVSDESTARAGVSGEGRGSSRKMSELFAGAMALAALGDTERESARAKLLAELALAELSITSEKEVLKRLKLATGANLADLERDYRKLKGAASGGAVTEDQVALAFIAEHGERLLYCHTRKVWFVFNPESGIWQKDDTRVVYSLARQASRDAGKKGSDKEQANAGRAAFATGVETLARSDQTVAATIEGFDIDPYLLGTPGGIIDLRSGGYVPAQRDARITRMTAIAPAEAADCPRFLQFL